MCIVVNPKPFQKGKSIVIFPRKYTPHPTRQKKVKSPHIDNLKIFPEVDRVWINVLISFFFFLVGSSLSVTGLTFYFLTE